MASHRRTYGRAVEATSGERRVVSVSQSRPGDEDGADGAEYAKERGTAGAIRRPINQMNSDWDDVSFVISSQYRIAVLRRLADGPATPSRIATDADLGIAHISRALQGLRERNLVELLVSEDRRKGRVYGITEKGGSVWQKIEAENMV